LRQAVRRAPRGAAVLQPAVLRDVWPQQVSNIPRRHAASLDSVQEIIMLTRTSLTADQLNIEQSVQAAADALYRKLEAKGL
jgi:hypothetical protein